MELTVARLKVLGEKDIANLDEKIAAYKSSNNPTILNKDLETIQLEIQQAQQKYNQLETEMARIKQRHTAAIQQRQQHIDQYKTMEDEKNKMTAEIDELFIQQQDYQSQITSKKTEVDKCLSDLAKEKQKLAEIISAHNTADAEYQENLKVIRESIARVENEIKESRQRAYQRYLDYETAVKEVSLEAVIARNPVNTSFAELVPELLRVFARNMGNFSRIREFYKELISNTNINIGFYDTGIRDYNIIISQLLTGWIPIPAKIQQSFIILLHENICDIITTTEQRKNIIGDIVNNPDIHLNCYDKNYPNKYHEEKRKLDNDPDYKTNKEKYNIYYTSVTNNMYKFHIDCYCPKCGYGGFVLEKQHPSTNQKQKTLNIDKFNIWLNRNYKKLCQTIITDAKLNAIIQNTTYDELFDMLGNVFDIKGYNTYEFMLFLAFLGTGGKAHNLYEEF